MELSDSPLTQEETSNVKEYTIRYRAEFYDITVFISSTEYSVTEMLNDENIKEKDSKKFPVWAIIVIVILGLILLGLIGFAIYKYMTHKTVVEQAPVEIVNNEKVVEKPVLNCSNNEMKSNRSHAPMIKAEEIKVNRYVPNAILEMAEL